MDAQITASWFSLYRQNGCKPVLCRGYHPRLNPKHDYKTAKAPITEGFTDKLYTGPTDADIEKHVNAGGWVGWVTPEGVLVLDYDDGQEDEALIEKIFSGAGIEPGIMRTNNGKQAIFKDPGGISGIEQYCKAGALVCYRIGRKNQCIWPPINGRSCEVWVDFNDLPDLPGELYPASGFEDHLHALSYQIGKKYRQGAIQGNDDLDLSFMAYLVSLNLPRPEALQSFSQIFGHEYDERRTASLYDRAGARIKDGEPLRGAGSFIQVMKDKGLDEIAGIATKIDRLRKGTEGKKPEPEKAPVDILSQLFTWDEIANLDITVEWLLEKLIPKGAITLVFCPGGGGKTWLLMQIARAIATGEPFGDLQTIQSPVYFIDFENPLIVVKERREKIGPAVNFYYWHLACPTGPRKLDGTDWEDYKQLPPGLLIFDTLRAAHAGDENSSKDMALILGRLKELREAGFTIVVLHHTPKGNDGTYKGSTAILDLADHVLSLENTSKRDDLEFDPDAIYKFGCRIKTRFEPFSTFLSFNPAMGFMPQEDPDIEAMKIMYDVLKKANKPLNQTEFKDLVGAKLGIKERRARFLMKKGINVFWTRDKGENRNARLYAPVCTLVHPIKVCTNCQTESGGCTGNVKPTGEKAPKPYEYQELDNLTGPFVQTVKPDFDNEDGEVDLFPDSTSAPGFQGAILHYTGQGISRSEAKRLVKEGL